MVELSGVRLHAAPRDDTSWEAGPASRREQAAKQAHLAAAELSKLDSRLATAGGAKGGGGGGASLRWSLTDFLLSWLVSWLRFEVKDVHVGFTAPPGADQGYRAFGIQLASLATIQQAAVGSARLAPFAGARSAAAVQRHRTEPHTSRMPTP